MDKSEYIKIIRDYLKKHRLTGYTGYRDYIFSTAYTFKERDLIKIVEKIKDNPNNAGVVQILLHKTFEKNNFHSPEVKIKKKKNPPLTNNERQVKFRNSSKKVVFQCMIDETLKIELKALKEAKNITYEQLLKLLLK